MIPVRVKADIRPPVTPEIYNITRGSPNWLTNRKTSVTLAAASTPLPINNLSPATVGLFAYPGVDMVAPDALVSGPDAAAYLTEHTPSRITGAMIRQWASRGWRTLDGQRRRLEAIDYEGPRRSARYRWTDLLDAERDTRCNPRSPGRGRTQLATAGR